MNTRHLGIMVLALTLLAGGLVGCETSNSGSKADGNGESTTSEAPEQKAEEASDETNEKAAEDSEKEAAEGDEQAEGAEAEEKDVELGMPSEARPMEGIITAGQPSKEQFAKLPEAGVTHVINLRTDEEDGMWEEAEAEEIGLGYTQIPVGGPDDLTRENVEKFDETLASADGDVLVHCGSSKRVGAMFALRAFWIQGKGIEEALEIGRQAGMGSLETAVKEKIK